MTDLPLFPVAVVGSWPRPRWLIQLLRDRDAGNVPDVEWEQLTELAAIDAIHAQEATGVDIVTDGEHRRDNSFSFIADKLVGLRRIKVSELLGHRGDRTRLEPVLQSLDVPTSAIATPVVVNKIRVTHQQIGIALDELEVLKRNTSRAVKIALPGPYSLTQTAWVDRLSTRAYAEPEELAADIIAVLREEITAEKNGGVDFIQLDEPLLLQLVCDDRVREPVLCGGLPSARSGSVELERAVRWVNQTIEGIDGVRFGVHVCRGNWSRREDVLATGDYGPVLPYLMAMNVHQLVLEFATQRADPLSVFREYRDRKEIGLGVVNPRSGHVEEPAQIVARVHEALEYFAPEKVFLNPDCGFATFGERNMNTPETATQKLEAMVRAAKHLRSEAR